MLTLNFKMADESQSESTGKRDYYLVFGQLLSKNYNCLQPLNKKKRSFKIIVICCILYFLLSYSDDLHISP